MSFNYSEFNQFKKRMERIYREFDRFLSNFLLKQALDALSKTKKLTPVDTGYLREMWQISGIKRRGDELTITIYNTTEYAGFVEYGHLTRDRTGFVRGKFMCTLSVKEVQRRIPARFEKEFKVWLAGMGVDGR